MAPPDGWALIGLCESAQHGHYILPGSKLVRLRKSKLFSHAARYGFRLNYYCSVRDREDY